MMEEIAARWEEHFRVVQTIWIVYFSVVAVIAVLAFVMLWRSCRRG